MDIEKEVVNFDILYIMYYIMRLMFICINIILCFYLL
jgi:uncharacterized Tic20 family protein